VNACASGMLRAPRDAELERTCSRGCQGTSVRSGGESIRVEATRKKMAHAPDVRRRHNHTRSVPNVSSRPIECDRRDNKILAESSIRKV
jgi:hypothetical protein